MLCIEFNKYLSIDWSIIQWNVLLVLSVHDLLMSLGLLISFPSKLDVFHAAGFSCRKLSNVSCEMCAALLG